MLHFLAFFYLGRPSAAIPLAIFVPLDFFISVAGLTAYRVLMVWVYDRTGESMLVAMLMHASYTACALILTSHDSHRLGGRWLKKGVALKG